jgi:uncharacterized protein (DUF433 family)
MDIHELITIEPAVRSGKPCLKGTRITVGDVLEYMASGMSAEQIRRDFPEITEAHIQASLAFAASRERLLHQTAL